MPVTASSEAGLKGFSELRFRQRRLEGEVAAGSVKVERAHLQLDAEGPAELVDRRAAGREVLDHLRGNVRRVGRHAVCDHAVIGGENPCCDLPQSRRMAALPAGKPFGKLFQTTKGAGRLGQGALALARATDSVGVRFG